MLKSGIYVSTDLKVNREAAIEATVSANCIDLCFLSDPIFPFNGLPQQERVQHFSRFQFFDRRAAMNRERALKVVLVVVGLIFSGLVYPLTMFVRQEPALAMMLSLYVTLGIFLLLADPRSVQTVRVTPTSVNAPMP